MLGQSEEWPSTKPKVGAECLNWARSDLCGGRPVVGVPTAFRAVFALQPADRVLCMVCSSLVACARWPGLR